MSLMQTTFNQRASRRSGAGRRCAGSSLIEVLVAMLVLASGILGMNALQTSSLKSNQNSYLRILANTYALDMVERLRANEQGNMAGNYNNPTPTANSNCLAAAGCSAAQMAANDVFEWKAQVAANMPLGAATICLDSSPDDGTPASPACDGAGSTYAIKMWWDDNRDGSASRNYVMTFRP